MEALQVVFKELYTSFLLRDFAGKIVPGCVLFFSISVMFSKPNEILKIASGRISFVVIFLIAALAWTVILGIQSIAELAGIWNYYPPDKGAEMTIQFKIEKFLRLACPNERLQYERFVVIKEATGNLFVVGLLSTPAWLWWLSTFFVSTDDRKLIWGDWRTNARTCIAGTLVVVVLTGLCIMNRRQKTVRACDRNSQ